MQPANVRCATHVKRKPLESECNTGFCASLMPQDKALIPKQTETGIPSAYNVALSTLFQLITHDPTFTCYASYLYILCKPFHNLQLSKSIPATAPDTGLTIFTHFQKLNHRPTWAIFIHVNSCSSIFHRYLVGQPRMGSLIQLNLCIRNIISTNHANVTCHFLDI